MNSITSHAPFHPVPPYLPDWRALLGPDAYGFGGGEGEALERPRGGDMSDDYLAALDYVLTYLAGYLRYRATDDRVLIIIGDHQPPARVSGPAASWDVPVHVIARDDRSLSEALAAEGFVAGLEPAPDGSGEMHELAARLLRALDGGPGAPAAARAGSTLEPRVDIAGSGGRGQGRGEAAYLPR
jgi:hypothetical protein